MIHAIAQACFHCATPSCRHRGSQRHDCPMAVALQVNLGSGSRQWLVEQWLVEALPSVSRRRRQVSSPTRRTASTSELLVNPALFASFRASARVPHLFTEKRITFRSPSTVGPVYKYRFFHLSHETCRSSSNSSPSILKKS